MSKTSTDPARHALNGPAMGTRWSALFFTAQGFELLDGIGEQPRPFSAAEKLQVPGSRHTET